MIGMDALAQELDKWRARGRVATLWWRDDDLGVPTGKLDPLLATAGDLDLVPMLAVVPAWASPELPERLAGQSARIAVHGLNHVDHEAGRGEKSEFGMARPRAERVRDIAEAKQRLADVFGPDLIACFVPPWNRFAPDLVPILPELGFCGLSSFAPRRAEMPAPGLVQVNTHIDLIDWRGDRGFIGANAMAVALATQLRGRRTKSSGGDEPIGLLSHHLEMSVSDWRGFTSVCAMLKTHGAANLLDPRDLFGRD